MLTNAKHYIIIIAVSLLIGFGVSYAWNNQTLSEMVEEHNQQILSDCLTKARIQKTAKEILEYASNCNKDILTNLSAPRSVETIEPSKWEIECLSQFKDENEQFTCWMSGSDYLKNKPAYKLQGHSSEKYFIEFKNKYGTHSTGNTVQPLGFQLIPTAEAKSVESASKELQIKNTKVSTTHSTIGDTNTGNVRTPKQIYEQVNCNTECKIETLTKLGITSKLSNAIVNSCKEGSLDPRKCIIIAASIAKNESGGGSSNACKTRNNCFGFGSGSKKYSSIEEGTDNFVSIYSRYWYKATNSSFFYPDKGEYSPSRYCYSETSSNSEIGCPFGQKHMQNTWNKLDKLF